MNERSMFEFLFWMAYFTFAFLFSTFLDFIFWSVVGLVLWFSFDTFRINKQNARDAEAKHMEMETISES